jgi:hypothetical protein
MNPKVLLVIVVVLVLLFVAGTAVGVSRQNGGTESLSPAWLEQAGGLLSREQGLAVDDLMASTPATCRQQLRQGAFDFPEGGSCRLDIAASSAPIRTLSLELRQGTADVVVLQRGERGLTIEQRLRGRPARFQFYEEGGILQISCPLGCRVEVP